MKAVKEFPAHPDRDTRAGIVVRRELLERLNRAARVTEVSGPAGSGKSVLLRSWIDEAGLAGQAAEVSVEDADRDPRRFWTSVAEALRSTAAGSALARPVTAGPDPDGWPAFERLLADLGPLRDRIWLVIDDLHALDSAAALGQLELMLTRAPDGLRFVLAGRSDLRLDLHRLRLEGGLTEIRAASLRFSHDEARALLQAAGVVISESALALLHQRTEGWAAGLRLAALSLTGHPDPERFAADFRGDDRTVAEYLLAEVLERQPEEARRLLRRTSVLKRVSGPLADRLTGGSGGEQILQELEQAGAFVIALDARRSWFRYHPLLADLLELELRRTEPDELTALHAAASDWLAAHGYPLEAVGHAEAAEDWDRAGRLLADHGADAALDGQAAAVHQLITSFPACVVTGDAELTAVAAAAELMHGSLEEGTRYLALAAAGAASVPADRRGRFQVMLTVLRLYLARDCGDLAAVTEEAQRLQSADWLDMAQLGFGDEVRALSLISLGIAELWSLRITDAEAHLEQGIAVARRLERPFLEVQGLAHWAVAASFWSPALAAERSSQAIALARRHGLGGEPPVAIAYPTLAGSLIWQGELDEAELWLKEAERALPSASEPITRMQLQLTRGHLEIARGRAGAALSAVIAAERPPGRPSVSAHPLATGVRGFLVHVLVRLGETAQAGATLAATSEQERERPGIRTATAALLLAQDDPQAASAALAPVLSHPAPSSHQVWLISAFLLEASARDAFGDREAAGRALERALDLAEPDGLVFPFQLHPRPELLEHHARQGTEHRTLTTKIIGALTGGNPAAAVGPPGPAPEHPYDQLPEPLSQAEARVLSLLQTSLSVPEIARELYVSVNTVRTHTRHLYDKLGAHRRLEAIDRARAIGLLAPGLQRALAALLN
jgi:LuxR family transcriptional regulator, maltose regulon positive regulatory protein